MRVRIRFMVSGNTRKLTRRNYDLSACSALQVSGNKMCKKSRMQTNGFNTLFFDILQCNKVSLTCLTTQGGLCPTSRLGCWKGLNIFNNNLWIMAVTVWHLSPIGQLPDMFVLFSQNPVHGVHYSSIHISWYDILIYTGLTEAKSTYRRINPQHTS